jgi:hypothetical protein
MIYRLTEKDLNANLKVLRITFTGVPGANITLKDPSEGHTDNVGYLKCTGLPGGPFTWRFRSFVHSPDLGPKELSELAYIVDMMNKEFGK